jgi:hypothetical protein
MTRKQIAALFASAFLVALISLLPVACGSGGGNGGGNGGGGEETPALTDVPRTTCKPVEPVVLSTPTDLPPGVAEYQSPERGYRVRYPSDWEVQPNQIAAHNIAGDVFFSPTAIGEIKPNISVSCETIPVGTTSQQFLDTKLAVMGTLYGVSPSVEATLTVDGKDASLVRYRFTRERTPEPLTVDKVDVLFADDLGGWTLTLVAPEGATDTYAPALDAFVKSFQGP